MTQVSQGTTPTATPTPTESPAGMELAPEAVLTPKEKWDIACLVLAFFCVVASLTMVVGTGNLVILTVGGSTSLSPFALAFVFMGMSLCSLATFWIFAKWGRKVGFWTGCVSGVLGAIISCIALVQSSPALVLLGQFLEGAGFGIGMCLRYSSVEVVSPAFASSAVAWVLAGGCFAAFVGPETAQATAGLFGDDENLKYMGTFIGAGFFFILQAVFVAMVGFPTTHESHAEPSSSGSDNLQATQMTDQSGVDDPETPEQPVSNNKSDLKQFDSFNNPMVPPGEFWNIIQSSKFILPLCAGILCWVIMALPMAIFRVTMGEFGFTSRQSLTVIEVHFLSMYAPGFWSGAFIKKYGPIHSMQLSLILYILSIGTYIALQENDNTTAGWFIGFVFLGIAWNVGFSNATVWSTQSYRHAMHLKPKVQAANDGIMFMLSGVCVFSTGYLYDDLGGSGLDGWRLVNYVLLFMIVLYILLLVVSSRQIQSPVEGDTVAPEGVHVVEEKKGNAKNVVAMEEEEEDVSVVEEA